MRTESTIIFCTEPVTWILYNKFVTLAEAKDARGHGCYQFAFPMAFQLLDKFDHAKCANCLFFFSDGKPSDASLPHSHPFHDKQFQSSLETLLLNKSAIYKDRLTFTAFGFGKNKYDFEIMRSLVAMAKLGGANASFGNSFDNDEALRLLLTSTVTSLTATRTQLSRLTLGQHVDSREKTNAKKSEFTAISNAWEIYDPTDYDIQRRVFDYLEDENGKYRPQWVDAPFEHQSAVGITVSKEYFGEGAERIVFKMSEIDVDRKLIGRPLVAKESLYQHKRQDIKHLRSFHKGFAKTQRRAALIADKFNSKLDSLGVSKAIPRIHFLSCSLYSCISKESGKSICYLAEEQLDPKQYIKWNDNSGHIDGVAHINEVNYEAEESTNQTSFAPSGSRLDAVAEGDESEDESEDIVDANQETVAGQFSVSLNLASERILALQDRVLESDVPQAFTHWTHRNRQRTEMVCDLQGELKMSTFGPVFQLTDPCIHSFENKYGKTDHGRIGMDKFYSTHQCNPVCEILGIGNGSNFIKR